MDTRTDEGYWDESPSQSDTLSSIADDYADDEPTRAPEMQDAILKLNNVASAADRLLEARAYLLDAQRWPIDLFLAKAAAEIGSATAAALYSAGHVKHWMLHDDGVDQAAGAIQLGVEAVNAGLAAVRRSPVAFVSFGLFWLLDASCWLSCLLAPPAWLLYGWIMRAVTPDEFGFILTYIPNDPTGIGGLARQVIQATKTATAVTTAATKAAQEARKTCTTTVHLKNQSAFSAALDARDIQRLHNTARVTHAIASIARTTASTRRLSHPILAWKAARACSAAMTAASYATTTRLSLLNEVAPIHYDGRGESFKLRDETMDAWTEALCALRSTSKRATRRIDYAGLSTHVVASDAVHETRRLKDLFANGQVSITQNDGTVLVAANQA